MSTIVVMMFWFVVILRFTRRTVRIRKANIAIIFFSRQLNIFLYIWTNQLNAKKWDEPCRHRNENTAHYRSQCSLTASVADKKCAFIVCSHMPFQFKCCVRGEITMLTYIWRLFTEEFQMNPIHVLPHIRFSATDICTFVTLLRLIFRFQVHPFYMFSQFARIKGNVCAFITPKDIFSCVYTIDVVFQRRKTSRFMATIIATTNHTFVPSLLVPLKIWPACSCIAAHIASNPQSFMDGLNVRCKMLPCFNFIFTVVTAMPHGILTWGLLFFWRYLTLDVLFHHFPNPAFLIFCFTFWRKKHNAEFQFKLTIIALFFPYELLKKNTILWHIEGGKGVQTSSFRESQKLFF